MTRHSYRFMAGLTAAIISGLSLQSAAIASDQTILETARNTATGQGWYNYLLQCDNCEARDEALGQLQLKQYEANGQLEIEGAASGTGGAADTALLELAQEN